MGVKENWTKAALEKELDALSLEMSGVSDKIGNATDAEGQMTIFGKLVDLKKDTDGLANKASTFPEIKSNLRGISSNISFTGLTTDEERVLSLGNVCFVSSLHESAIDARIYYTIPATGSFYANVTLIARSGSYVLRTVTRSISGTNSNTDGISGSADFAISVPNMIGYKNFSVLCRVSSTGAARLFPTSVLFTSQTGSNTSFFEYI